MGGFGVFQLGGSAMMPLVFKGRLQRMQTVKWDTPIEWTLSDTPDGRST